jgi:ABC-type nitrate/sulfonate/bicarbonate transport system permease component
MADHEVTEAIGSAVGEVVEAELAQLEHEVRRIAAGGWVRALIGFAIGAAAGLAVALVVPRDEGPRRRVQPHERPLPFTGFPDGSSGSRLD